MSIELKDDPKVDLAKVVVVDGEGPCLLRRDLIGRLGLIKNIHEVSNKAMFVLCKNFQNYSQVVWASIKVVSSLLKMMSLIIIQ